MCFKGLVSKIWMNHLFILKPQVMLLLSNSWIFILTYVAVTGRRQISILKESKDQIFGKKLLIKLVNWFSDVLPVLQPWCVFLHSTPCGLWDSKWTEHLRGLRIWRLIIGPDVSDFSGWRLSWGLRGCRGLGWPNARSASVGQPAQSDTSSLMTTCVHCMLMSLACILLN